jgi:hypothetical protein
MSTRPQPDLFEFAAQRDAERDPLNLLLATPADRTVLDNLPPGVTEAFVLGCIVAVDGSGPRDTLLGTTLARWDEVRRVLALAWGDRPRRELPEVCRMARPKLEREQRRRVEALAAQWPWEAQP